MTMSIVPVRSSAAHSHFATIARDKLGALIERGRARAAHVLDHIETEVPRDQLARVADVSFEAEPESGRISVWNGARAPMSMHAHALGQAADKAGLPRTYLGRLMEHEHRAFGPQLLAHNLNQLFHGGRPANDDGDASDTFLLRSVRPADQSRDEVRGFLSSKFKRIDSRPIVAAFANACGQVDAFPYEGYALDTKIALKAVLGRVFEPVPGEIMAFGMCLENSDYGNGALSVSFFALRLACTNGMLMEKALRRVHLGSRLTPDTVWSARTIAAETEATASAVHDLVSTRLNDRHVRLLEDGIRRAHDEHVSPAQVDAFTKKHVSKAEAEAITLAFNSADVENMPAGQNRWRFAQAVSWIAGHTADEERRLELMKVAGAVVPMAEAA